MTTSTILIHQTFASKDEPGGTRHYELGKRLVAHGQQFTIIASDVSYQTGKRLVPQVRIVTESLEDGIRLLRVYTYSALHKSYLKRVVSFLTFMATSVLVGFRAGKPDVVMGTTPPIFQAVSAWMLSALHQRPFLLEVRDLWPEFAIDIGLLKNRTLIRLARWLESFLYSRADHLLVNSPAYRDYMISKGVDVRKISFISNGVDPAMFDAQCSGNPFRSRFHLEDKFVVMYAGAIGMANDLDCLLAAAELLKERNDIHFVIVGDGKERRHLEDEANRLGLYNVTFAGSFPKSEMAGVLAAADACVAILRKIKMFTTTYPNKVFDYMAAARPTILAIDGVIREVIEASHGGVYVEPGNPRCLASAIAGFADVPESAKEMGSNARAYVIQHFNREDHARQFVELITRAATGSAIS
jgi:glycosyltransferase involved in cell wall biosynthesis